MSKIQRLVTAIVPRRWAAAMEAASRTWIVRCPSCGYERSVWEMGGIRWKAAGDQKITARCLACDTRGSHTIYRRRDSA
jgi:hypothetical protein